MPHARVHLASGPVPVPDIAALTNAEGQFTITVPAAGTYEIVSTADGYAPASVTVEVDGGQERPLDLWMDPSHHDR